MKIIRPNSIETKQLCAAARKDSSETELPHTAAKMIEILVELDQKVQSVWNGMSRPIRVILGRQMNVLSAIKIYKVLQADD